MAELTPMMQQYYDIKKENPDCILFFRLGDFYEMFSDDARTAARELDLVLTTRDKDKSKPDEEKTPMCGIPYHSCDSYIARLVSHGYKVAICEQMEDPALAKGLVKRDITRIVTPGTVTESVMLDESKNNYFACIYGTADGYGLAFCDVSTGSFFATVVTGADAASGAVSELARFQPSELLLGGTAKEDKLLCQSSVLGSGCCLNYGEDGEFSPDACTELTKAQFGDSLQGGAAEDPLVLIACGALLSRMQKMQRSSLAHLRKFEFYRCDKYLRLNPTSRRNLELTETLRSKEKRGTLLWVLDKTKTPMGSRLLRAFLEKPLLDPGKLNRRLDAVEELYHNTILREELQQTLRDVSDIERCTSRIVTGTANCQDMLALAASAACLPQLRSLLGDARSSLLLTLREQLDELADLRELVSRAIREDAPPTLRDGGLIKDGFNEEVDRLRTVQKGGTGLIVELEAKEKERTGIKNLRIRYNRVFGYSIEVSKGQVDLVPADYIRKQTLVNGERYITQELKELEATILTAKDRITALEFRLFTEVRTTLAAASERIFSTAHALAYLDVLTDFAAVSVKNRYCRPVIDLSSEIELKDSRHPVVEQMLKDTPFVPNDILLGTPACRAVVLTGPNMAGKSTYMRQVALCVLMAQIGCFVPARSAHIGIVDRIFTRVGASDDLAAGQSTFMVEMTEVAEILTDATPQSLIVLDEIGRGTSTFDGMAIAQAVLEACADPKKLGAKTLFATHYHELAAAAEQLPGVQNFNIAVKKRSGDMVFLRRIVPGAAGASYGIEVAKLAGVHEKVLSRARALLEQLESGAVPSAVPAAPSEEMAQLSMADLQADTLRSRLQELAPETLTPIEALNLLFELKKLV